MPEWKLRIFSELARLANFVVVIVMGCPFCSGKWKERGVNHDGSLEFYNANFDPSSIVTQLMKAIMPEMAKFFYGAKENNAPVRQSIHIYPKRLSNGTTYFINKITGEPEAIFRRQPGGLFSYWLADAALSTRYGGRDELKGIKNEIQPDNNYFNQPTGK